ncbi:hypothetical protein [Actinophytocola algeriensis]|uniref:Uncharacterized protein n=1 Tax=Actinophytocola algeriensis TaxID=1768010 RepID=A0A7W7VEC2_9PSEU|nr:hypothetical protein [Actinophytocola algeriensis]MBB4907077.1 hypothetical protein [Actinophytocola algeriensis]MBE1478560.1 hypothetical protein [Actinophytocola algeriensis]
MDVPQVGDIEIRLLLDKMTRRGWTLYEWGHSSGSEPEVRGAAFFWDDGAADVVLVRRTGAVAYRTPPCRDVFVPELVTEWDSGVPVHALRAALTWDEYGKERVQRPLVTPPPGCALPPAFRHGLTESVRTPNNPNLVIRPAMRTPHRH